MEHRPDGGEDEDPGESDSPDGAFRTWPEKSRVPSPEDLGPDPPSTKTSSMEETSDPDVASLFWRLVLVFDVALLGLALGPVMIVVLGWWERGLLAFGLGVVLSAYGTYQYRGYRRGDDRDGDGSDAETGDSSATDDQHDGDVTIDASRERNG